VDTKQQDSVFEAMDRRQFLKAAGVATGLALTGGIHGMVAAQKAPAFPKGTTLHLLQQSSFVRPADDLHRQLAKEFGKLSGIEVTIETVTVNDLRSRIATAVASGTGPDIIQMLHHWPHRYANALADVDDVAEPLGKRDGGYYDQIEAVCRVDDRWKAVPFCLVPFANAYRVSWFQEVGVEKFPDTWDEYRQVGKRLKAKGRPIGQAFGRSFDDPTAFFYPLLWSFGGKEVERDGKTIALISKETEESVKFCVAFFHDACDEGGLAWDKRWPSRNRRGLTISSTLNEASLYFSAKRKSPAIAKDTTHALLPQGPAGRFHWHITQQYTVMKYSKNQQAAKEYLTWLMDRKQWQRWFRIQEGYSTGPTKYWENDPLWRTDPRIVALRDSTTYGRHTGYAGPPTPQALEARIIVEMYARAILGMSPKEAINGAVGALKQIYKG
jgi:multiple sugar transport system substrate-binding protein